MDDKTLLERLQAIEGMRIGEDYPETMDIIDFEASEDLTEAFQSAYDFAEDFAMADADRPMHPAVADFVKEVCEEEIEQGSEDAPCLLGSLYYSGRIGEQNFAKAVELYTTASERGNVVATENLGYCYYYGRSVPIDYEKAFYCYAQGAFDGRLISLYKIGDMYRNGYYVAKNEKEAFNIYNRCNNSLTELTKEECGADIYLRLCDCYFEGIGIEKNFKEALKYYQKAVRLFIDRIMNGDFYLRNNYRHCVERENQSREILEKGFPDWTGFKEKSDDMSYKEPHFDSAGAKAFYEALTQMNDKVTGDFHNADNTGDEED